MATVGVTELLKDRESIRCACGEPVMAARSKARDDIYEFLGCKCGSTARIEIQRGSIWLTTAPGAVAFFYRPKRG